MEESSAVVKSLNRKSSTLAAQHAQTASAPPSASARPRPALKSYILDTNVLIHDPNSILNFEEHHVIIPMTVLEELDKLKSGKSGVASECRQAIRLIDQVLGAATVEEIERGVPIQAPGRKDTHGTLTVLLNRPELEADGVLANTLNDNRIINSLLALQRNQPDRHFVLVTKDINMRLKARSCGLDAEDYHNDQLVSDIRQLNKGYFEIPGSFWDSVETVETRQTPQGVFHTLSRSFLVDEILGSEVHPNQFLLDEQGFVGRVVEVNNQTVTLHDLPRERLMHQNAWGLKPINIHQAIALHLLLDPDVHIVNLTGAAGSGKTILALAASIEMVIGLKRYNKIIATRSTPPLAEEHGFLPGTEEEKMDPWLGAITDNIEALHLNDENPMSSIQYVKERANIQFKALNYIRGRSFQRAIILIDECQNLTPHQMKAIITRAGEGSKVVCLGNLAQIDTPYLSATSSGLAYMAERFKGFAHGGSVHLNGVPRSVLAEFAESNL
ncbi:MAG: PhoH family protein [Pseudomonadota bacterium]